MAQPTSSLTRFIGPVYVGSGPPTAAIIGKPLEEGMMYVDTDEPTEHVCFYVNSAWVCSALNTAVGTATSTSTSTSTTTTAT